MQAHELGKEHLELFRELSDLKRLTSAAAAGSFATRLFVSAWDDLMAGERVEAVMHRTASTALIACRLGDMTIATLRNLGLTTLEARDVAMNAFDDVTHALSPHLLASLRETFDALAVARVSAKPATRPAFLELLTRQPRAGVTCPGRSRLMLLPQENHAEHCVMVAVFGVILAPVFGADPSRVFLAGLSHHLHNAFMPDSGFAGEMLLGEHLEAVVARARETALAELAHDLNVQVRDALAEIATPTTHVGRALHAADVLDRVIEIEQHFKLANLSFECVLEDYGLVHDGPAKEFHDSVLASVGLFERSAV